MTQTSTWIHLEPDDLANASVRITNGMPYPMTTVDFGGGAHVTASKMPATEFSAALRALADIVDEANAAHYQRGCEQGAA